MNEDAASSPALEVLLLSGLIAGLVWLSVALVRGKPLVRYEPRRRVPWSGFDVALSVATMLLTGAVVGILVGVRPDPKDIADVRLAFGAVALSEVLSMAIILAILAQRARPNTIDLGFDARHWWHDLGRGLAAFLLVTPPVLYLHKVLTIYYPYHHPVLDALGEHPDWWTLALATWLAVVIAPLFEEFVFRVVLQGWLEGRESRWRRNHSLLRRVPRGVTSIALSSFAFALAHAGSFPAPIPLFFFSLAAGYLYRQTHRILPSLVLHMCFNGLSISALWAASGKA